MKIKQVVLLFISSFLMQSCDFFSNPNDKMVKILEVRNKMFNVKDNFFSPEAEIVFYDSIITNSVYGHYKLLYELKKGESLLKLGKEYDAVKLFETISNSPIINKTEKNEIYKNLAIAYMRLGERQNCLKYHVSESCIMPILKEGNHRKQFGSLKAIEIYKKILTDNPLDYESRWLLNIAYMTLGGYPLKVPNQWLIPNMDKDSSGYTIKPFLDVAPSLGMVKKNMAGGAIVDDFNNDDYLDIMTSDCSLNGVMYYYQNDTKNKFVDCSKKSEIGRFKGGLNMIQADYDNDGDTDVFVLRGAWKHKFGMEPNSLLRNNGDGTFTDVTIKSGLFSEFPTQTGTWNDFNNDGFLDLFIGNESDSENNFPCELYLNNQDGTFTNVAKKANCDVVSYVKGVASCDYDNDGKIDLFLSGMNNQKTLLKNVGIKNRIPQFVNVTQKAGLSKLNVMTFPTWFWDYDNDGWQDLFVCGYKFGGSIASTVAKEALNISNEGSKMYLYHNNHDGTFSDVSKVSGLNKSVFAMGANFGDIDNDGFLDMYLGTGNPNYSSIIPNKLYRNTGNGAFVDVTVSGRVGNLQKGHAVAISDLDNDGDSDIFIEIGGAYIGDAFNNSLFLNPGQNTNRWIGIQLEGTDTNKSAIGSKIKLSFKENGVPRSVYVEINSGGSFGASALRKEIGIGQASMIDQIEITWAKSHKKQFLKNIKPNQFIKIKEGKKGFLKTNIKKIVFPTSKTEPTICI